MKHFLKKSHPTSEVNNSNNLDLFVPVNQAALNYGNYPDLIVPVNLPITNNGNNTVLFVPVNRAMLNYGNNPTQIVSESGKREKRPPTK